MNNTIKFSVDESNNNKRLDVFLADNINEFTRSFLKKLIEDKQVRLNNIAISSPSIKVKYQDQITIKIIEKNREHHGEGEQSCDKELRSLLQYVCDYEKCELTSVDFEKRKRSKNNVPIHEQCIAKKADCSRCTRRKRDGSNFCGTHIKGTPHGHVENKPQANPYTKRTVWIEEINGISYYIDGNNNVYDSSDIVNNVTGPRIIAKYEKNAFGVYSIPSFKRY